MSFQICNVDHPNSPVNTCAFCVFEAPDNITNLKIALERFQDQVDNLHKRTWRYNMEVQQHVQWVKHNIMYTCTEETQSGSS